MFLQASHEGIKRPGKSRPHEQDPDAEVERQLTCAVKTAITFEGSNCHDILRGISASVFVFEIVPC